MIATYSSNRSYVTLPSNQRWHIGMNCCDLAFGPEKSGNSILHNMKLSSCHPRMNLSIELHTLGLYFLPSQIGQPLLHKMLCCHNRYSHSTFAYLRGTSYIALHGQILNIPRRWFAIWIYRLLTYIFWRNRRSRSMELLRSNELSNLFWPNTI